MFIKVENAYYQQVDVASLSRTQLTSLIKGEKNKEGEGFFIKKFGKIYQLIRLEDIETEDLITYIGNLPNQAEKIKEEDSDLWKKLTTPYVPSPMVPCIPQLPPYRLNEPYRINDTWCHTQTAGDPVVINQPHTLMLSDDRKKTIWSSIKTNLNDEEVFYEYSLPEQTCVFTINMDQGK